MWPLCVVVVMVMVMVMVVMTRCQMLTPVVVVVCGASSVEAVVPHAARGGAADGRCGGCCSMPLSQGLMGALCCRSCRGATDGSVVLL